RIEGLIPTIYEDCDIGMTPDKHHQEEDDDLGCTRLSSSSEDEDDREEAQTNILKGSLEDDFTERLSLSNQESLTSQSELNASAKKDLLNLTSTPVISNTP
ncbi:Putative LOC754263, partial [Caligus rogercresseyi]